MLSVGEELDIDLHGRDDPRRRWAFISSAERNAAYDSNAAFADSQTWIDQRNAWSTQFRAQHAVNLDIPYGPLTRQRFDLYLGSPGAPCLVFIHGGYWQRNSREAFAIVANGLLAHGWSVAVPGHTLAPDATLTAMVAEIGAALDWLQANGSRYGLTGPVILSGWSSGAHLAAMGMGHDLVRAVLSISGVYELGPLRDVFANEKLRLTDDEIARCSPLRLPAIAKPMTIAYGTRELPTLVNDSRRLHAVRAATHMSGSLIPVAGADHFSILDEICRPDGCMTRAALALAAEIQAGAGSPATPVRIVA